MFSRRFLLAAATGSGGAFAVAAVAVGLDKNDNGKKKFLAATPPFGATTLDPHAMQFPKSKWEKDWDKRDPTPSESGPEEAEAEAEAETATATRHLVLIRHGQYNLGGKTDEEKYLTELGRDQAAETGRRLAALGVPVTKLVVSSMTRAKETAELIRKSLPPETPCDSPDDLLREGAPIRPEPDCISWRPDGVYDADGARIEAAFRKYFHRADAAQERDSYEVIVCHSNVIRYFVCRALQVAPEAWMRISLRHASITWVSIRPNGTVAVKCLGDAGHFPPDMMTTQ